MSRIINLNRVRKDKARAEKRRVADQNAVSFGRTKSEKARDKSEAERAARDLDGKKQE